MCCVPTDDAKSVTTAGEPRAMSNGDARRCTTRGGALRAALLVAVSLRLTPAGAFSVFRAPENVPTRLPNGYYASWKGLAGSGDLKRAVAIHGGFSAAGQNGRIWYSNSYGQNWWDIATQTSDQEFIQADQYGTPRSSQPWRDVCMSGDGKQMLAVGYNVWIGNQSSGVVHGKTRGDGYGENPFVWTKVVSQPICAHPPGHTSACDQNTVNAGSREWKIALCSSDFKRLLVGVNGANGHLYASDNYGRDWTQLTPTQKWNAGAMSGDGQHIVVSESSDSLQTSQFVSQAVGDLWVSHDFGATFSEMGAATAVGASQRNWNIYGGDGTGVDISDDGQRIVAAHKRLVQYASTLHETLLWYSDDGGSAWASLTSPTPVADSTTAQWQAVALASGAGQTRIVACAKPNGCFWTDDESGSAWNPVSVSLPYKGPQHLRCNDQTWCNGGCFEETFAVLLSETGDTLLAGCSQGPFWSSSSVLPDFMLSALSGALGQPTSGGQDVHLAGIKLVGSSFSATYGPPSDPNRYNASACTRVSDEQVTCVPGAGVGTGLYWTFTIDGRVSQPLLATAFAYQGPTITGVTVTGSGGGGGTLEKDGSSTVDVSGTNLGPTCQDGCVSATLGNSADTPGLGHGSVTCDVVTAHVLLRCQTPPGTGTGFRWIVTVGGQASPASSATTDYAKECACPNGGVARPGADCAADGDVRCASCNGNYFLYDNGTHTETCQAWSPPCASSEYESTAPSNVADRACAQKACACANGGTGAVGDSCPNHGDAKCTACTGTYFLNVSECQSWSVCESDQTETSVPSNVADRGCARALSPSPSSLSATTGVATDAPSTGAPSNVVGPSPSSGLGESSVTTSSASANTPGPSLDNTGSGTGTTAGMDVSAASPSPSPSSPSSSSLSLSSSSPSGSGGKTDTTDAPADEIESGAGSSGNNNSAAMFGALGGGVLLLVGLLAFLKTQKDKKKQKQLNQSEAGGVAGKMQKDTRVVPSQADVAGVRSWGRD